MAQADPAQTPLAPELGRDGALGDLVAEARRRHQQLDVEGEAADGHAGRDVLEHLAPEELDPGLGVADREPEQGGDGRPEEAAQETPCEGEGVARLRPDHDGRAASRP